MKTAPATMSQVAGENALTCPSSGRPSAGRDRGDKPEYRCACRPPSAFKPRPAFGILPQFELAGARRLARKGSQKRVRLRDSYLKQNGKYNKGESKITFQDVQDCLMLVTNSFSTHTSYENQTKRPSTTVLSRTP